MLRIRVPEYIILGHPNAGKSSVVSSLAEDDSVWVSQTPGETLECDAFPVIIDGKEIIRFIDTPGFQNSQQTLLWMKKFKGSSDSLLEIFLQIHTDNPAFATECKIFFSIVKGAGVIFVADGSRPLGDVDRAEMEILRLTGCPRMAVINDKDKGTEFFHQWKTEFRKHFNSIRMFNAYTATFAERVALLESFKNIDQEMEPSLRNAISVLKKDWEHRNTITVEIMYIMLTECLKFTIGKKLGANPEIEIIKEKLQEEYTLTIRAIEKSARQKIKNIFKQNIFDHGLPDLFIPSDYFYVKQTGRLLESFARHLVLIAGLVGGRILRRRQITIGPVENIQFLYTLIDRILIFYSCIINRPHGRRDYDVLPASQLSKLSEKGFVFEWKDDERDICLAFFEVATRKNTKNIGEAGEKLKALLKKKLKDGF